MDKRIKKDLFLICPGCGNFAHYSLGQVYCVNCGTKLIDRCPKCGEKIIYPTAKHCPFCGERLLRIIKE